MAEQIDSPVTVVKYRRHWEDKTPPALAAFFAFLVAGSIASLAGAIASTSALQVLSSTVLVLANSTFLTLAVKNAAKTCIWVLVEVEGSDPDWTESKVA